MRIFSKKSGVEEVALAACQTKISLGVYDASVLDSKGHGAG